MEKMIDFSTKDYSTIIILLYSTIAFVSYWFIANSKLINDFFLKKKETNENAIYFYKSVGFIIFGPISLFILYQLGIQNQDNYSGLILPHQHFGKTIFYLSCLTPILVVFAFISARKSKNWINYPQVRIVQWKRKQLFLYLFFWAIYLLGYEFLFRGFLFFPLIHTLGFGVAVAINVTFYTFSHIPKGLDETIGAFFLGIALCFITAYTQSIWVAVIAHIFMAWTNSLTALYFNTDMQFIKRNEFK